MPRRVAGTRDDRQTREDAAAGRNPFRLDSRTFRVSSRVVDSEVPDETADAEDGPLEEERREEKEVRRAEEAREARRQRGPGHGSERPADGDETEEPSALLRTEEVGEEAPEHRHGEEIEDARPDEEGLGDGESPRLRREGEERPEEDEGRHEKAVDDRDEDPPGEPRDECAEERVQRGGAGESPDEEPRQGVLASPDAHFVPERADDVVARQQQEEVRARPSESGTLSFAHLDGPRDEGAQAIHVRPPLSAARRSACGPG